MSVDPLPPNVLYNAQVGESAVLRSSDPPGGEGDDASDGPVEGHAYGPPTTIVRESNYISDENLLAWLATKQDGLYGELRDHMDTSRARSKLVEDLNHLKGLIDAGGMDHEEATAEINRLLAEYEGTEFEGALKELFAEPLAELATVPERAEDAALKGPNGEDIPNDEEMVEARAYMLSLEALTPLAKAIENKVDALGRDDQLELIQIQSLTADLREVAQLASNLMASSNQTANTIVGNIAR